MLQAAGYQAILHGRPGGYRSHILAGGRWTVWHGTARQGAVPPHLDWQQHPNEAYYVTADPWPLAVLLHTISAPNKKKGPPPHTGLEPRAGRASTGGTARRRHQDRGQSRHPRAAHHAQPPGTTLAVAQQGQQGPQWVISMFSPADAHMAVCDPERLPGPEAVVCVADCARVIVKALQEGEHHALLVQVCLKDNAKAAKPGLWPAAARPPPPGGRSRVGPGGRRRGVRSGPGSRRSSQSRVRPRGTGPLGRPVGPPGSVLPTPHGSSEPGDLAAPADPVAMPIRDS